MSAKTVYILHKTGANSHYVALEYLLNKHGYILKYREFSVFSKLFKSLFKLNFKLFKKQFINLAFMAGLLFSKNKKIVLGIAPFDSKLLGLLNILKNHKIYYHTSWTYWDQTFHPKTKNNSQKVLNRWKGFLENETVHIFTVTQKSKEGLLKSYEINPQKISVVYHSLHPAYATHLPVKRIPNSFIYLGRLTTDKGIRELLTFAEKNPKSTLTIVGAGKEENFVKDYAERYPNIHFEGFISNKEKLIMNIRKHQFLVLNSKTTKKWEELFGLIIIEAMSQGTIPIAPAHSGPKEIINPQFGYLFEEGEISSILAKIMDKNPFSEEKSQMAIKNSKAYRAEKISTYWKAILEIK